jgi:uncharacterized protein (DUF1501 family)
MLNRRQFLERSLRGSSLIALGTVVPNFLATAARAAQPGKDTILVVLEMTGGNDGLNTVIPYADDLYHRYRPTLRLGKQQVVRVDDHIGLNPGMRSLEKMLNDGQLAVIQGVGYPNPDRSHFESMDIWQSADPKRKIGSGWLGRSMGSLRVEGGHIPGMYLGAEKLPLALQGSATGVPTIHPSKPYDLELTTQQGVTTYYRGKGGFGIDPEGDTGGASLGPAGDKHLKARRLLIEDLAKLSAPPKDSMLQFVQRSALQTYTTIERLRKIMEDDLHAERSGTRAFFNGPYGYAELARNLRLIGHMIAAEFGTRIFYVSINGFDTHANQQQPHQQLLQQVADAVTGFFTQLEKSGHAKRVVLMTFSEFGRRVQENGSQGTDHGAASCMFLAGPAVKGGAVGKHPSLADLDNGDLRHHTDFRQVYATLLDGWLGCSSQEVLGEKFPHIPLLKQG